MRILWNVTKGICMVTGAYCWISAIVDSFKEYNEHKDDPLVQPIMFMGQRSQK